MSVKRGTRFPAPSLRELVRERRNALGLTQVKLAKRIGIKSGEYIAMVESGARSVDLNRIPQLAQALELDPEPLARLALFEQDRDTYHALFDSAGPPHHISQGKPTKTLQVPVEYAGLVDLFVVVLQTLPVSTRRTLRLLLEQFSSEPAQPSRSARQNGRPTI